MKLNKYYIINLFGRILKKFKINPYFIHYLLIKKMNKLTEDDCFKELEKYHPDLGSSSIRVTKQIREIKYDIQIIVPVYNVEKYLEVCLDSILNQKFNGSYIVTIINDGSTDNSGLILNKYVDNPRCEIITKENGGLSSARNKALDNIKGKYLFFLDSDDFIPDGTFQKLFDEAVRTNNRIIYGPYQRVDENNNIISTYNPRRDKVKGCICGKLYESSLFENLIFPDKYWFEDTIVAMLMGPEIKDFSCINDIVYYYRENTAGISHSAKGNNRVIDTIYITRKILDDLRKAQKELNLNFYDIYLEQVRMNQERINSLGDETINKLSFKIHCALLSRFPAYNTLDKKLKLLEWSLRNKNYTAYLLAI